MILMIDIVATNTAIRPYIQQILFKLILLNNKEPKTSVYASLYNTRVNSITFHFCGKFYNVLLKYMHFILHDPHQETNNSKQLVHKVR